MQKNSAGMKQFSIGRREREEVRRPYVHLFLANRMPLLSSEMYVVQSPGPRGVLVCICSRVGTATSLQNRIRIEKKKYKWLMNSKNSCEFCNMHSRPFVGDSICREYAGTI